MYPLKLLLVEDSEDILFIMKTELEWMGYRIDVATNAEFGMQLAKAERPDVVISDIQMPGMDGFEFIRKLRELPALATIPAIALTGFGMEKDIRQTLDRGFTAYLTKPVEPSELSQLIEKFTRRKEIRTRA